MLKDIKLPLNLSVMEALTCLSFLVIGYLFIYRFCYYNTLGISWYITSISPAQVITSSGKILFNFFIGGCVAFIVAKFAKLFKSYKEFVIIIFIVFLYALWAKLVLGDGEFLKGGIQNFFEIAELSLPNILHFILTLLMIYAIILNNNKLLKVNTVIVENLVLPDKVLTPSNVIKQNQKIRRDGAILNYLAIFIVTLITPANMGNKDALHLLEKRDVILSQAVIKGDTNKWYLVDVSGDKILLIKENKRNIKNNEFKLIEYKDIKSIIAPYKDDMDTLIINYAKKFVN